MLTGRLIYLMGPSGAGKDTLIRFIDERQELPIYLPKRFVTRPVNPNQPEHHIALTPAEFANMLAAGEFSCHWRANGYDYGLGLDVTEALQKGLWVLINGSRAHYQRLPPKLQDAAVPVYLDVSAEVQLQRLLARGREQLDDIVARIARSNMLAAQLPAQCLHINAEQSVAQVYADFKAGIGMPIPSMEQAG